MPTPIHHQCLCVSTRNLAFEVDGAKPDPALRRSIEQYGILVPLLVERGGTHHGEEFYWIIDGRRRFTVARALGYDTVPVVVVDPLLSAANKNLGAYEILGEADRMFLTIHTNRHRDLVRELHAVEGLLEDGADDQAICQGTGLTLHELRRLRRLQRLPERLREAFNEGKLSPSVAEAVVRSPQEVQEALARVAARDLPVTYRGVLEARKQARTVPV